jgi:hypothetical protein
MFDATSNGLWRRRLFPDCHNDGVTLLNANLTFLISRASQATEPSQREIQFLAVGIVPHRLECNEHAPFSAIGHGEPGARVGDNNVLVINFD